MCAQQQQQQQQEQLTRMHYHPQARHDYLTMLPPQETFLQHLNQQQCMQMAPTPQHFPVIPLKQELDGEPSSDESCSDQSSGVIRKVARHKDIVTMGRMVPMVVGGPQPSSNPVSKKFIIPHCMC